MPGSPWTPDRDPELVRMHGDGWSLHRIHVETGWAKGSISKAAARLGLTWDTSRTASAVRARKDRCADLRSQLEVSLLEEAGRLVEEMRLPHLAFAFGGKDNTYTEQLHDQPDAASKLKLMQAAGAAVDRALKIDAHTTAGSADGVKSLLSSLGQALGVTQPEAASEPDPGPEPEA